MLKRIELFNFMSHEHSVIDLAEGLTVLIGPNNCGKSAIVTALQTVCQYESSKFMLRHGERECLVRVETQEGDIVEWSRTKSGSPMYRINGTQYDRLNRTVPSQLHEILKMPLVDCDEDIDVHFGEQKSPTFLLNDKPSSAAKFFASTSDTIRLFEMQSLHRKRVQDRKKERKRLETEQSQLEKSLEILKPLDRIRSEILDSENDYQAIRQSMKRVEHLEEVISQMGKIQRRVHRLERESKACDDLLTPPKLHETGSLESLIDAFQQTEHQRVRRKKSLEMMQKLSSPPELPSLRPLESTVASMENAAQQVSLMSKRSGVLGKLATPLDPNEESKESKLSQLIVQISAQSALTQSWSARSHAVEPLTPPPALGETSSLAERVAEWDRQLENITALQQKQVQASELASRIETQIKTWYETHPVCPTCGQPSIPGHPPHSDSPNISGISGADDEVEETHA